jgi:hypothetical protein
MIDQAPLSGVTSREASSSDWNAEVNKQIHGVHGVQCNSSAVSLFFLNEMVYTCVVFGCGKRAEPYIRTLHEFPRDVATNNAWKRFVKRTRANWKGPSSCTRLCSDHFARDSYVNWMAWSMHARSQLDVKPCQVPTMYPEGTCATLASLATTSKNLGPPSVPIMVPVCLESFSSMSTMSTATGGGTPSKRPRTAARKLEIKRVSRTVSITFVLLENKIKLEV